MYYMYICSYLCILDCIYAVVTVQFQQPQFTGTEESQVLIATVVLSGGTVSFPFAVTVTSSSRTAIGLTLSIESRVDYT